jgi:MFS family permease
MTFALFAALMLVSNFRYENSDDGLIVRAFMGFEGGEPASFSLYVHTLLSWLLWALGKAAPAVPWFSVFQMGLLLLSCAVLARAFLTLAAGYRRATLVGGAAALLYLLVFAAFACCRINYMTTAALAGAAAVAQCLATPLRGNGSVRGHALWLLLFGCAFCLRSQGALPSAAFLGLALAWRLLSAGGAQAEARASRRGAAVALLALAGLIALLVGVRQAELSARGLSADVDWHAARTLLLDYTGFEAAPQLAAGVAGGLPAPLADMVARWYFLDSRITTEALRAMAAAYAGEGGGLLMGWQTLLAQDMRVLLAVLLTMLLGVLCLAAGRGGPRLARAAAALAVLGAVIMLSYLTLTGRAPARAADAVLMPCGALLLGLLLTLRVNPLAGHAARRAALALLCAAVLAVGSASVWLTRRAITRAQDVQSMERARLFTQVGLAHPDWYVLRSPNLFRDSGLTPYAAEGVPANTAVWGDWTCRTPSWYAQLAILGFDGHAFTAADWLREGIVLVSVDEAERAALCAYIGDAVGGAVEAVQVGENGGLTYYRFVRVGGAL